VMLAADLHVHALLRGCRFLAPNNDRGRLSCETNRYPFLSTANVGLRMRRFSGVASNVSIVERRNEYKLDHALNAPGNRRCHPTTRSYCHVPVRDAHAWSDIAAEFLHTPVSIATSLVN